MRDRCHAMAKKKKWKKFLKSKLEKIKENCDNVDGCGNYGVSIKLGGIIIKCRFDLIELWDVIEFTKKKKNLWLCG